MAKNLLRLLLFLFLIAIFPTDSYAQTLTSSDGAHTSSQGSTLNQGSTLKQPGIITQLRQETRAEIETERNQFKIKVQAIKDQRRKTLVQNIDARIAEVNKRITDNFTDTLNRLQTYITKASQATQDPKVLSDINNAQDAINLAKTAVSNQAGKVYTMQITDDLSLRLNAQTTVGQFRQDILATYKTVVDAKTAVLSVRIDHAMIKKEASSSASL